jgi:hypothetical protein
VAISLTHVGADRINHDQRHIAGLSNQLLQSDEVSLQVEAPVTPAITVPHCSSDANAVAISPSCNQARNNRVGYPVLRIKNDDAAQGRTSLTARPVTTLRDCSGNRKRQLALTSPRLASNAGVLAPRNTPRPEPLDSFGFDLRGIAGDQDRPAWF